MPIFDYTLRQHKFRENQKVFVLLHLTSESASDILERRALLKFDLLIKFSQSLNTEKEE